jgi:hypothetical protein
MGTGLEEYFSFLYLFIKEIQNMMLIIIKLIPGYKYPIPPD